MSNPATVQDVVDRFRPLTEQETTNAVAFLDDAWWMILGRRPNIEANIEAGTVLEANVIRIIALMVRRILLNPEGLLEEAIDDYRKRRDALVSTGTLRIEPDELSDLTPGGYTRVKSVRLVAYGER